MIIERSNHFVAPSHNKNELIHARNLQKNNFEEESKLQIIPNVEKRLLHKYRKEDPNRIGNSIAGHLSTAKLPLVVTGGLGIVSMFMGHGIISLILLSLGSLFVISKIK